MKLRRAALMVAALLVGTGALVAPNALAGRSGGGGHGGGHVGGHGGHFAGHGGFAGGHHFAPRVHAGVFIGAPFYAPFYPYPLLPSYYDPMPYVDPYYEQVPNALAPPRPSYWYYCPSSNAYYPYVKDCPEGWQQVAPQPPP